MRSHEGVKEYDGGTVYPGCLFRTYIGAFIMLTIWRIRQLYTTVSL